MSNRAMPLCAWGLDPDNGGVKVPDTVKRRTETQLRQVAAAEFVGRYTRLDIRFRGVFCYVDAYTEPEPPGPNWPPPDGRRPPSSTLSGCGIRRRTCVGCATSAPATAGVSASTPTATSATSCRSSPAATSSARQRRPCESLLRSTSRVGRGEAELLQMAENPRARVIFLTRPACACSNGRRSA
jgi:hypothetical protein